MSHPWVEAPGDPYRYGVYLRPDPSTCWAVTTVTGQLRAQYGLQSAGAFPPHATLVGSQHIEKPAKQIVDAVGAGLDGVAAFPVYNHGPKRQGVGVVYDVHHLDDGITVNSRLIALAATVAKAMEPLVVPAPKPESHTFDHHTYRGHLSLASHDLYVRPDLRDEVADYVRDLPVEYPDSFLGDTVTLYRTASEDWTGRWWTTLTWTHLCTWTLPTTQPAAT